MLMAADVIRRAWFEPSEAGRRYCRLTLPAKGELRGLWIHCHAFAEELNKTRRMIALQADACAHAGIAVLQWDLLGCGDSEGLFDDASWSCWRDDVDAALAWARREYPDVPRIMWGMRLGALLALDTAHRRAEDIAGVVLWQPYWQGRLCLTQFFRLESAARMLTGHGDAERPPLARAMAGEAVEVAGYTLSSTLVQEVAALDALDWTIQCPAVCVEVVRENATLSEQRGDLALHDASHVGRSGNAQAGVAQAEAAGAQLSTATRKWIAHAGKANIPIWADTVNGTAFWLAPEIEICDELIARTLQLAAIFDVGPVPPDGGQHE